MVAVAMEGAREVRPTIREVRPHFCFAHVGNVVVIVWNLPPDLASFNLVEQHMVAVFRDHPEGVGLLVLSRASTPPGGEIAKEGAAQLERWGKSVVALAAVQEQTGILSALIRVTMQTIAALVSSKNAVKPKLFGSLDEAAAWLAGNLHGAGKLAFAPEEFPKAVRLICEKYPPAPKAN